MRVVLASGNRGKLAEFARLLAPFGIEMLAQSQFGIEPPPETGHTFLENALIKARYAAEHSGLPAMADDSGIEVDALQGAPGVWSARYAGEGASDADNNAKLLAALAGLAPPLRRARYRCVIAWVKSAHDPAPVIGEGRWDGTIIESPRGSGGFGYDPLFVPTGETRTAAELDPEIKNAQSHRGAALRELLARWRTMQG